MGGILLEDIINRMSNAAAEVKSKHRKIGKIGERMQGIALTRDILTLLEYLCFQNYSDYQRCAWSGSILQSPRTSGMFKSLGKQLLLTQEPYQ